MLQEVEKTCKDCEMQLSSLTKLGKYLLKDNKAASTTSTVNSTQSNINRRFDRIKTNLHYKQVNLKQIIPQLEVLESGLEDEQNWINEVHEELDKVQIGYTLQDTQEIHERLKVRRTELGL